MSIFFCQECQQLIDSDFIECHEVDNELMCDTCAEEAKNTAATLTNVTAPLNPLQGAWLAVL